MIISQNQKKTEKHNNNNKFISELTEAIEQINIDISVIKDWANRNGLTLNLRKTISICICYTNFVNKINPCSSFKPTINGNNLSMVQNLVLTINNT